MIPCTDDSLSRLLAEVERDIAAELRAEIQATDELTNRIQAECARLGHAFDAREA